LPKVIAAKKAGFRIVRTSDADSGVSSQPFGDEEIFLGAYNRSEAIRTQHPDACGWIGVENGIDPEKRADYAIVVVVTRFVFVCETTEEVVFPKEIFEEFLRRQSGEPKLTVGQVCAEKYGSHPQDPHRFLTQGRRSRIDILSAALRRARARIGFIQRLLK
jgi:non-canonical (house-cleaning) NTP pyrophosphatase